MLTTLLQSNSTTHQGHGLQFVQVMKNRVYHEGIKCLPYETMFGQPDEQNNLTEDPAEEVQLESPKWTSNNLVDNADMKGQYLLTSRKKQVQKISHLQKW